MNLKMIKFAQVNDTEVEIINDKGEVIGKIFSASDVANVSLNAIQVCGFSEAFDYWACGNFVHKKDIQLLFNNDLIAGEFSSSFEDCQRCFHKPCQCEDRKLGDVVKLFNSLNQEQKEWFKTLRQNGDIEKQIKFLIDCQGNNPFNVRKFKDIKDKLDMKSKNDRIDKPSDIIQEKGEVVGTLY